MHDFTTNVSVSLGIKLHFCHGAHVIFPRGQRKFHLKVTVPSNGESVFDSDVQETVVQQTEFRTQQTYHIPWQIEIWQAGQLVVRHQLNLTGQQVCLDMQGGDLADLIPWMGSAAVFQKAYNGRITVLMKNSELASLFASEYPQFTFLAPERYSSANFYACYPFDKWNEKELVHSPVNYQRVNPQDYADSLLMTISEHQPPLLAAATEDCAKAYGKYVCLTAHAQYKMQEWNNPDGWAKVVEFLKKGGYRVFNLDDEEIEGTEKLEGENSLARKLNLVRGCAFTVGVASGYGWLAWACGKPVVLVAGCTENGGDFPTKYRVSNAQVCHGCYHRCEMPLKSNDACPDGKDFVCTSSITAEQVIEAIKKVPEYKEK